MFKDLEYFNKSNKKANQPEKKLAETGQFASLKNIKEDDYIIYLRKRLNIFPFDSKEPISVLVIRYLF